MTGQRIERLAVVPSTPLLLPGATGREVPAQVQTLRARVTDAVRWLGADARCVEVIVAGAARSWGPAPVAARQLGLDWSGDFGRPAAGEPVRVDYPNALLVAAAYTGDLPVAGGRSTPGQRLTLDCPAVLIVGGGSARRGDGAPGHVDPRAVPHDDETARMLRTGDVRGFTDRDLETAAGLLDDLSTPMAAVGDLTAPRHAALDYYDAPYGVAYFVARWQW